MAKALDIDFDNMIITELLPENLIKLRENSDPSILYIIKFTAPWCGPCQKIKQVCEDYYHKINKDHKNITCFELDIDETMELYVTLKQKKMVNGIPVLLAYKGGRTEHWFIPNDSITGGNTIKVAEFFERCIKYSISASSLNNKFMNTSI